MTQTEPLIAGVELGGTKCIATLAQGRKIIRQERWPTQTVATLDQVSDTLSQWHRDTSFSGIGIASFGPIHVDPQHPSFGRMGNTPKPGWAGVDVRAHFADRFDMPIGIDTDVAGAALAEGTCVSVGSPATCSLAPVLPMAIAWKDWSADRRWRHARRLLWPTLAEMIRFGSKWRRTYPNGRR